MMKKLGLFLFAVLFIAALSSGCDNLKGEDGKTVTSGQFEKTGTIQGFLFDAVTGARLGGNDTKIRLFQGTERRDPTIFITDTNDKDYGYYAYGDVPISLYARNLNYQVFITRTGYQDFRADVAPAAIVTNIIPGAGVTDIGENDNFIKDGVRVDAKYNMTGNIYIFPLGVTAGSITVKVTDPNQVAVAGATVRLQQQIGNNVAIAEVSPNRLAAAAGLMPNVSAVTGTDGIATFTDSTLVLGGCYVPTVDPLTYKGQQLRGIAGAAFIVGTNRVDRTIALLANLEPALYVASATNSALGTVTATGVLTLTFNKAISLNIETLPLTTQFTAVVNDTSAVTATVTASLDATSKILTLTPTFTPAAGPTGAGANIVYTHAAAGRLISADTQAIVGNLGGGANTFAVITDKTGTAGTVSCVVQIKSR